MPSASDLGKLGEQGKRDFGAGRYEAAAEAFRMAASGFSELGDSLNAAEQRNNLAVALLKLRRPQEALEQVAGTEGIFAAAGDARREGMAANNRAVALQDLGRANDALAAYERAAQLLGDAGEAEYRGIALKAAAAIDLRQGRVRESGMKMLGVLGSGVKPKFLERALKSLLRR